MIHSWLKNNHVVKYKFVKIMFDQNGLLLLKFPYGIV